MASEPVYDYYIRRRVMPDIPVLILDHSMYALKLMNTIAQDLEIWLVCSTP